MVFDPTASGLLWPMFRVVNSAALAIQLQPKVSTRMALIEVAGFMRICFVGRIWFSYDGSKRDLICVSLSPRFKIEYQVRQKSGPESEVTDQRRVVSPTSLTTGLAFVDQVSFVGRGLTIAQRTRGSVWRLEHKELFSFASQWLSHHCQSVNTSPRSG